MREEFRTLRGGIKGGMRGGVGSTGRKRAEANSSRVKGQRFSTSTKFTQKDQI